MAVVSGRHTGFRFRQAGGYPGNSDISIYYAGTEALRLTATVLAPGATDSTALGTTALMFSDLFLASGGVINFNNGDVTLTHSTNALTLAGGTFVMSSYTFTAGTPAVSITTTNASVHASTSAESFLVSNTQTGVAGVGGRARFYMTTNVALGGWSNALKAEVAYGATGRTTGLGSAFVAEMAMSAGTTSGTYAPLEVELTMASGASLGTRTGFMYMAVSGTGKASMDTSGVLFKLDGLTAASGKLFQANTAAAATHALKIDIGGTLYYVMLTDTGA